MHVVESPVVARLNGTSSGGSGPDLTGYPHLVYAPAQWGDGVRCGSNGTPVVHVAASVDDGPIAWAASRYSVSLDEALDAYKFAKATGLI